MEAATCKASASAESQGDDTTSAPHCAPACPMVLDQVARAKTSASGFRKFREALVAKKFESYDNLPVEVGGGSGLFIGSFGAANNLEALKRAGITDILCVSPNLPLQFPDDFIYLRLEVADLSSVRISTYFDQALAFMDMAFEEGGKVLVHCFMGQSRSATMILAYMIARQGLSLSDALQLLRQVRPQAKPNRGFYRELLAFDAEQKQLREQQSTESAPSS